MAPERARLSLLALVLLAPLTGGRAAAQAVPRGQDADALHRLAFADPRLSLASAEMAAPLDAQASALAPAARSAWSGFRAAAAGEWRGYLDRRSGHLAFAEGAGIPWIPGRGNGLTAADLGSRLGAKGEATLATLEGLARDFVAQRAELLGVDPASLVLSRGRSGRIASYLWFVDFDVQRGGMAVEGARVVFRINNGNLIQLGSENLPPRDAPLPVARLSREDARQALAVHLGGFHAADRFLDAGSLHLLPTAESGAGGAPGRGLLLVWQLTFRREGVRGTWRGRVDAASGRVVELYDVNDYAQVTGGVYPNSYSLADETPLPMPFADLSTGGAANSAGIFPGTGVAVSTALAGPYVRIVDTCGILAAGAGGDGSIALGSSAGTDCATPGTGGAGNTHAARTQYYHVNRAKEVGRGWLPGNAWLAQQLRVDVNLDQTCNAYWDGATLNFFKSGFCGNTGEIAGISIHEYGHGLDSNDGDGDPPDHGTGETTGDWTAALALHQSCIGQGLLPPGFSCLGYGDFCTGCSGVRDIDWARHLSHAPATVASFTQVHCQDPPPFEGPAYVGPCRKEGHCESHVSSEALWDLAARDLPDAGGGAAWSLADRLWYLSRSTATAAFTCDTATSPWTSDGCAAGTLWRTMRAVDDDDGNLANGTPHGAALFAAFDRHGIACPSDPGAGVSFAACTPPAVPAVTLTPGDNAMQLSWSDSGPGATYEVYRSEAGCGAGFTKVASGIAGTAFADTAVADGLAYSYQVVAHATGNEACGAAPSTCQTATPAGAACAPPAAPAGLTASSTAYNRVDLAWSAVAGATAYHVLRAPSAAGPFAEIAALGAAATGFADVGVSGGSRPVYTVRAFLACESADSSQASATVAGSPCAPRLLYSSSFESAAGLAGWSVVGFGGTSPADWQGVQACPAHSGGKIFRFGGAGCSAPYGSNQMSAAVPAGSTGIAVPAGARGTRLSFWHRRDFETGFDGGTLLLSLDGASFTPLPAAAIVSGASYDSAVSSPCPAPGSTGLPIFSSTTLSFAPTVVDLDAACDRITGGAGSAGAPSGGCGGRNLFVAFTAATDCAGGRGGWYLDDVAVTSCAFPAEPGPALGFYTVPPCRLVDTRAAAGPALQAAAPRSFALAGACGIPADAKAVAANLTVTGAAAPGDLRVFPGDPAAPPVASTINFAPGQTRANGALLALAGDGTGTVTVQNDADGAVHLIVDVSGYFK